MSPPYTITARAVADGIELPLGAVINNDDPSFAYYLAHGYIAVAADSGTPDLPTGNPLPPPKVETAALADSSTTISPKIRGIKS